MSPVEIARAVTRGGRHGRDAEEKRPACLFAAGATVGPVKLELQKDLARHLRAGHPWVYKRAIERPPPGLEAGAIVDVTSGGKFVARGYYDPAGAVRVRVLTRDPAEAIGPLFWRRRVARAVSLRRAYVLSQDTDCARLVHGEGDVLPGVVVDLYGRFAVLKLYSPGLAPHRSAIVEALRGEVALDGIYGRDEETARRDEEDELSDRDTTPAKGQVLWGVGPGGTQIVREHGMRIAVDVYGGQKTGYFLDQRVISVDRDEAAMKLARRNFQINEIDPASHGFVTGDVLEFLRAQEKPFDLIVLDPPAFAKSQKAVPAALDGYASLHRAAFEVLAPGGILATASCSARVSAEEFAGAIREAAVKTRTDLQLLEERRQPVDHPVLPAFPEGRYLKFFVYRKAD